MMTYNGRHFDFAVKRWYVSIWSAPSILFCKKKVMQTYNHLKKVSDNKDEPNIFREVAA